MSKNSSSKQRTVMIDWANTRALSLRQPHAEAFLCGERVEEYRGRRTNIRERVIIYASLSREDLDAWDVDELKLPRGLLVGTIELHGCLEDEYGSFLWLMRNPERFAEPIRPTAHPQPVWFYPFGRDAKSVPSGEMVIAGELAPGSASRRRPQLPPTWEEIPLREDPLEYAKRIAREMGG